LNLPRKQILDLNSASRQVFLHEKCANWRRGWQGARFGEALDNGTGVTGKIVVLCGNGLGFGVCRGKVMCPKDFEIRRLDFRSENIGVND
jgi:hypothetical protein